MNFYIKTLGCKVNQSESESCRSILTKKGWQETTKISCAQLIIVNSCTVTHVADRKSRNILRRLRGQNTTAKIILTGCMPANENSAIPKLNNLRIISKSDLEKCLLQFPDIEKKNILQLKKTRVRKFLKVQDGCDYFCSYCVIPFVRNNHQSLPISEIENQLSKALSEGVKEIILTGINLGKYNYQGNDIVVLIKQLLNREDFFRIRISSIEPNLISDELLQIIDSDKRLAPHLHIPLQGSSDRLLQLMNRKYNLEFYDNLVKKINSCNRQINIATDLIVGFPSEEEEDVSNARSLLEKWNILDTHFFKFSPRKGTLAFDFNNQINDEVKKNRMTSLISKMQVLKEKKLKQYLGQKRLVLNESINSASLNGYSGDYIKCRGESSTSSNDPFVWVIAKDIEDRNGKIGFKVERVYNKL